jgi:hypothetical protein
MIYTQLPFQTLKFMLFVGLLLSASNIWAQEELAVEKQQETESMAMAPSMQAQSCPVTFNQVPIPESGKLCQIFAADFPASMVLHVPQVPNAIVQFYQDTQLFGEAQLIKERFMMQSEDKNTTVIVSADGEGSQVDILVKRAASE